MNYMKTNREKALEAYRQITKILLSNIKDARNEYQTMFLPALAAGFLRAYRDNHDVEFAKAQLHSLLHSDPPGMHLALCTLEDPAVLNALLPLAENFSADEFAMAALQPVEISPYISFYYRTPNDVMDLSASLMNVRPGMSILDLCSGPLSFFIHTAMIGKPGDYTACEINYEITAFAEYRAAISSAKINIVEESALRFDAAGKKFDRIFIDPPYGEKRYGEDFSNYPREFSKCAMEWRYIYKAASLLKDDGIAIGVIPIGNLYRKSDEAARRYMTENGMIQSVIILPDHISTLSAIKLALIVITSGNHRVQLIDASGYAQKSGVMNRIPPRAMDYIKEIQHISDYKTDAEGIENCGDQYYQTMANDCVFITPETAASKEYVLTPDRYAAHEVADMPTKAFGTMIDTVRRGQALSRDVLDSITADEQTHTQYLSIADINDGAIQQPLRYISDEAEIANDERIIIHKDDILITKAGNPTKVAWISEEPSTRIIVSGNIYIIRLNSEFAVPGFIAAYLESAQGKMNLKNASKGMAVSSIALEDIKNLPIPELEIAEQEKIAAKYIEIKRCIAEYQKKITLKQTELDDILSFTNKE